MPQTAGIYYGISKSGQPNNRPPIVLLHGAGSSHQCWPAKLRRLTGYTVYALDLPGHGNSIGIGQHTIAAYAAKVIDFLSVMDIYKAILIGHSMGGAIALQAAYQYPDQISAIGLIASGAYIPVAPEFIENLSNQTMMPFAIEWLKGNLFTAFTPEDIIHKTISILEQARPGVLYGDWQACAQFDLRPNIAEINAPALIVAGDYDKITPISGANFITSKLKNASMQILSGTGHMLMLEKPDSLEAGLRRFLAEVEN